LPPFSITCFVTAPSTSRCQAQSWLRNLDSIIDK